MDRCGINGNVSGTKNSLKRAANSVWATAEGLWLIKEGFVLAWSMGFGIKWVFMTVRIFTFGFLLWTTFFRLAWWYMNSPKIFRRVFFRDKFLAHPPHTIQELGSTFVESVGNDNNRAYLDIHYPVCACEVLRAQYARSAMSAAATAAAPPAAPAPKYKIRRHGNAAGGEEGGGIQTEELSSFPVVICITGGGWIVGSHYWSAMLGRILGDNGYLVVSPDYRNFPQAPVRGMLDDVTDSIAWVFNNIESYGGDPNRITVMGQSAGAHLVFLSLAEQVEMLDRGETPKWHPRNAHRIVGLSGLYDLVHLQEHLHNRGLYKRVLHGIVGGEGKEQLAHCSPLHRFRRISPEALNLYLPKEIVFIHGRCDNSTPYMESETLANVLQTALRQTTATDSICVYEDGKSVFSHLPQPSMGKGKRQIKLFLLADATHTTPFVEDPLMQKSEVVEILCALDGVKEPMFHLRPPMAGERCLKWASWVMPF